MSFSPCFNLAVLAIFIINNNNNPHNLRTWDIMVLWNESMYILLTTLNLEHAMRKYFFLTISLTVVSCPSPVGGCVCYSLTCVLCTDLAGQRNFFLYLWPKKIGLSPPLSTISLPGLLFTDPGLVKLAQKNFLQTVALLRLQNPFNFSVLWGWGSVWRPGSVKTYLNS